MLKGIHPHLSPQLLYALAAMGHGDELALVDRNFPAASVCSRPIWMTGVDIATASAAILSVFPLDTFVAEPVLRMEVVGDPESVPAVQEEFLERCRRAEGWELRMGSLSRQDFYDRARSAFSVVATSEPRAYGCFLLVKGVIQPDDR